VQRDCNSGRQADPMQLRKIIIAVGVSTLAVAGCGTEVTGQPAGAPTTTSTTSPAGETFDPSGPPTAPTSPAAEGSEGTPSGTTLTVGQTATVKWETSETKAISNLEITAASVQKGAIADLKKFQLDAQTKASEPYYVTMKFTNKGPQEADTGGIFGVIDAQNSSGDELARLSLLGTFDKCDGDEPDKLAVGASYTYCQVYIAPAGQNIDKLVFMHYAASEKQEITWTA
jgi:hypothetical protein